MNSIYMDLCIWTFEKMGIRLQSPSAWLQTFPSKQLNGFGNLQRVPETSNDAVVLPAASQLFTDQRLVKLGHFHLYFIFIHCS